jgi:hypothetical protein
VNHRKCCDSRGNLENLSEWKEHPQANNDRFFSIRVMISLRPMFDGHLPSILRVLAVIGRNFRDPTLPLYPFWSALLLFLRSFERS